MILHVGKTNNTFNGFIFFVKDNFNFEDHLFIVKDGLADSNILKSQNVIFFDHYFFKNIYFYFFLIIKLYQCKKVIFHGLFNNKIILILFFMPWLLKKSYWMLWGDDLYTRNNKKNIFKWYLTEFFRKPVLKNISKILTYIKGDYELAKKWYGAKGEFKHCLMYPGNLYKKIVLKKNSSSIINIQVGNSADPSNNHLDIFKKLEKYKNKEIKIIVPLSYGNKKYAKKIIQKGKEIFGNKFVPIVDYVDSNTYTDLLSKIDIAIFNHNRQQAMGNIITLLGLGKKVYIKKDISPWKLFSEISVKVFDNEEIDLMPIPEKIQHRNIRFIKNYFSEENFASQLREIFR